ncbi:MAG: hypothetical protein AAFQ80_21245 [Cyanobacteria bacterium J06621_8]
MHFYQAYCLIIKSTLELPELIGVRETKPDVIIKVGKLLNSPLFINNVAHCYQLTTEGMYAYWEGVGTFLIKEGREIIVDPVAEADEYRLRLFILGAAIGTILHQRGLLVLHASGVDIDGQAVVFMGNKGWGKSTIAANLNAKGYNLIGDDVIAIDLSGKEPMVLPAFPQLKLWPDAVASLGMQPENLPRLVPHLEKRNRRVDECFSEHNLPLKQIYVLGKYPSLEIQPLKPQEIIKYLIINSYVTRFGDELLKTNQSSHFAKLAQIAKRISIHHLLRPINLELLSVTIERIENHVTGKQLVV